MKTHNMFVDKAVLDTLYTETLPRGCSNAFYKKNYYAGGRDSHIGRVRNKKLNSPIKNVVSFLNTLQYFEKEF